MVPGRDQTWSHYTPTHKTLLIHSICGNYTCHDTYFEHLLTHGRAAYLILLNLLCPLSGTFLSRIVPRQQPLYPQMAMFVPSRLATRFFFFASQVLFHTIFDHVLKVQAACRGGC